MYLFIMHRYITSVVLVVFVLAMITGMITDTSVLNKLCLKHKYHLLVLVTLQTLVIEQLHNKSRHLVGTLEKHIDHFYWPACHLVVMNPIQQCHCCQKRNTRSLNCTHQHPNEKLSWNIMGHLPTCFHSLAYIHSLFSICILPSLLPSLSASCFWHW